MFTFDLTQKVSGEKTINAKVAISRNGKYGLTAFSEKTAALQWTIKLVDVLVMVQIFSCSDGIAAAKD